MFNISKIKEGDLVLAAGNIYYSSYLINGDEIFLDCCKILKSGNVIMFIGKVRNNQKLYDYIFYDIKEQICIPFEENCPGMDKLVLNPTL